MSAAIRAGEMGASTAEAYLKNMTITEHLESIIPHGQKCYGCPKSDPKGIQGYSGDVFCHLMEETMIDGDKQCGFNEGETQ